MKKDIVKIKGLDIEVYSMNTIVVGTGVAGFNAADSLYNLGQTDVAIVTEGVNMGTSRNTGSDKQTYYKITLSGDSPDSVVDMAGTLFAGGSMHGDIAMVEAALSARSFCKLANIGVPFPHNKYGEYIGYKTDHDPRQRATSAGPLTSRFMTEKLEQQVKQKGIKIFDGYLVIGIITEDCKTTDQKDSDNLFDNQFQKTNTENKKAIGLIALNLADLNSPGKGLVLFNCINIIYATGGPAGMYKTSVYPGSQTGASGIAFEAGARGINLTESQYGIASVKFRWNLSGTYQQVIPRYISTDQAGEDEKEFLDEYFDDTGKMLDAIFLKGYQWPFDPRKVSEMGSSMIDIIVYYETRVKGRRVFMDFMRNPENSLLAGNDEEMNFTLLGKESYDYLQKSGALFGRPIDRLLKMNKPAIDLYLDNGIDITKEYLEIAVCAQHNNGGLKGNIWWESNVKHLFPVGEVNGTFGVYRPGGSALNSTQVGSLRAAQFIKARYTEEPREVTGFVSASMQQVKGRIDLIDKMVAAVDPISSNKSGINQANINQTEINQTEINQAWADSRTVPMSNQAWADSRTVPMSINKILETARENMSAHGAHIRSLEGCSKALGECYFLLDKLTSGEVKVPSELLPNAFRCRDILLSQVVYLSAIMEYIGKGGKSRGSYLICDINGKRPSEKLPPEFQFTLDNEGVFSGKVCETWMENVQDGINHAWLDCRPLPKEEAWFENVWNAFMRDEIIR
ncbi:MAG: FAD-binding protein [Clostridiales bacterium]|nr:FAD-binding protein [Clostridiales bacterium]